jgi:RNA polymerase-binding transcription factor DksA
MKPTALEDYRRRLTSMMERLDRDRSQLKDEVLCLHRGKAGGFAADVSQHLTDAGSHGFDEQLTWGLLQNTEQTFAEVMAALVRLDRGVYGRCERCRKRIAQGRLKALPDTRHCLACAQKLQAWPLTHIRKR